MMKTELNVSKLREMTAIKSDIISILRIEGSRQGPHLLITAGVHGDEYEPMEACRRLYYRIKTESHKLRGTLTIVPVVNRMAFEAGNRTGNDGLDLARICPGNPGGSETERAAHAVSELIRKADYYIDMHNGGTLHNIYPFAGYMIHPDSLVLEAQREMATAFGLPMVWGTDPSLNGRTLSVARDAGVPAIYTEIGGCGVYNEQMTVLAFEGCLNVLKQLEMLPEPPRDPVCRYHLEDHRSESGYLQKLMPAPCDGFFLPRVSLGTRLWTGDLVGHIQDETGMSATPVLAGQDGILFILRNTPPVRKGDALGGILPVDENPQLQIIYG